jgi:hypothetical protein
MFMIEVGIGNRLRPIITCVPAQQIQYDSYSDFESMPSRFVLGLQKVLPTIHFHL